jgi:hypothetical protein
VKRLLKPLFVFVLLMLGPSCGEVFVRGALISGSQTAIGVVSIVQFSVTDAGTSITVVTLLQSAMANTLSFCGDQRSRFPLDQPVRVTFTPGSTCGSVVVIEID